MQTQTNHIDKFHYVVIEEQTIFEPQCIAIKSMLFIHSDDLFAYHKTPAMNGNAEISLVDPFL